MKPLKLNKRKLMILVIFLIFFSGWFIYFFTRPTITIHITSEEGSTISITRDSAEEFEKIGESEVRYRTRVEGDIYIKAEKDASRSLLGLTLFNGDNKDVHISIDEPVEAEKFLSGGSYSHAYIEETSIHGIEPGSSSIINFDTDAEVAPRRIEYLGIPSLKKIAWQDIDNFAYSSFRSGVGLFVDGNNRGNLSDLAPFSISGDNVSPSSRNIFFSDLSWHRDRPLVLLGDGGIYLMRNTSGVELEKIISLNTITNQSVFSDNEYIYINNEVLPGDFVTESDENFSRLEQIDEEVTTENTTDIYDYSGNGIISLKTTGSRVISALSINEGETVIALGDKNISVTSSLPENSTTNNHPTIFEVNRDMIDLNGKVFVLADGALWRFLPENGVLQLVYSFVDSVGLGDSFVVDESGEYLHFGTQASQNRNVGENALYRVLLSDLVE